jgi:hypothetical protein
VRNSNQPFSLSILPSLFSFSIWRLASDKHDLTIDATVTVVATGARVNRDPRQVPISPTPRRGRRHRRREDWLWRHHLPPRCRPHSPLSSPFTHTTSLVATTTKPRPLRWGARHPRRTQRVAQSHGAGLPLEPVLPTPYYGLPLEPMLPPLPLGPVSPAHTTRR